MNERRYTIQDLCGLTGLSRRTIRYYVQEGLVEPPAGRGRGGFYFDSHLEKLRRIQSFQKQGLRLSDIRAHLEKGKGPVRDDLHEVWIRYPVGPGVEIHVRHDLPQGSEQAIAEIVRVTRSILESGGKGHE